MTPSPVQVCECDSEDVGARSLTCRTGDCDLETRDIIREFLQSSGYEPHITPPNAQLRIAVTDALVSWKSRDSIEVIEKFVDCACDFAETAYGHISPEHLHYVALYTAIILYIDDLGGTHLDAIQQFVARFTRGDKQLSPALDTLVDLLRGAHQLWTQVGADAVIAGTLDAVTAMYIEYTTEEMEIKPHATWFPYYLRTRSGICPPYIHFIFMKSWRATSDSYLQMMPYMERWVVGAKYVHSEASVRCLVTVDSRIRLAVVSTASDILSFYKEQLAGETNNYIHMRACAEQTTPINVLRDLCEEILHSDRHVLTLTGRDNELAEVWQKYVQGTLEFHVNTPRYRLRELGLTTKGQELCFGHNE